MDQVIKIKRSTVQGSVPTSLEEGEIAINTKDGYIYTTDADDNSRVIRLYRNATQEKDGLLSSSDKTKIDKLIFSGDGDMFLTNSGDYKSIVSSLVLDYETDLLGFSGIVSEEVVQSIEDAIQDKIPVFISVSGTLQYLAFAGKGDSSIILSIDSGTDLMISSITVTISLPGREISSSVMSCDLGGSGVVKSIKYGEIVHGPGEDGQVDLEFPGASDILLTGYKVSEGVNGELEISPEDTLAVGLGKLQKQSLDNEKVISATFNKLNSSIGFTSNVELPDLSGTNYLGGQKTILGCLEALDNELSGSISSPHPVLILKYTEDLKNGIVGSDVTEEVSKGLLEAIDNGWACVIKSGNSDILSNIQKIGNVVTIVMESINKLGNDYLASTTIIGVNTDTNKISSSDSGAITLVDRKDILEKGNTEEYIPESDYSPATKKYVDDYRVEILGKTVNQKPIESNPVLSGGDIQLTGYQRSEAENENLYISGDDSINTAMGKLEKAILDDEEVISSAIVKINGSVGLNEEGDYTPTSSSLSGLSMAEAIDWLCNKVETLEQALTLKTK